MYSERLIKADDPPELRKYLATQLRRDLEWLRKGSQHLRMLGWLLLVPTSFLSFVLFIYMLMRPEPSNVALFAVMLFLLGTAGFYFAVSASIRRARRWAVNVALGVAFLPIVLNIMLASRHEIGLHKRNAPNLAIETLVCLMHLRVIIDLIRCLGAVQRISDAARLRYGGATPATDEPWDRPDRADRSKW